MDGVRSYRAARRTKVRGRAGSSILTASAPQAVLGAIAAVLGGLVGFLIGGPSMAGAGVAVGAIVGAVLGSRQRDGRDPFQQLRAMTGRRRGVWSPQWGRLNSSAQLVRWKATVDGGGGR